VAALKILPTDHVLAVRSYKRWSKMKDFGSDFSVFIAVFSKECSFSVRSGTLTGKI
jgi:hypothetical protein